MELDNVLRALRNADAAGDVEDAKRLAQIAKSLYQLQEVAPEPAPSEQPKSGFLPALKASYGSIKGDIAALAGRTGLMDPEEAQAYQKAQEEEGRKIFKPTEQSFLQAPATKFGELLGGSLPYMVAPAVAGALAPEGLAALAATGALSGAQFVGSNLSRQMQEGTPLAQTNLASAALAAVPQAALDVVSLRMIPGVKNIFGSIGAELTDAEAKRIASQGLGKTLGDYALQTGKTAGVEGLTEAAQQVLERLQAGLSITDPDARQEYLDNFLGGAVLGGALAPIGRYGERAQARQQAQAAEQNEQANLRLNQVQAAQTQAPVTPEYAQQIGQQYESALAQYRQMQQDLGKKPGKDADPDLKAAYDEKNKAIKDHLENVLKPLIPEYNRTKAVRNQLKTQQQQEANTQALIQKDQEFQAQLAKERAQALQERQAKPLSERLATAQQQELPGFESYYTPPEPKEKPGKPKISEEDLPGLISQHLRVQNLKDEHLREESEAFARGDTAAIKAMQPRWEFLDKEDNNLRDLLKQTEGYKKPINVQDIQKKLDDVNKKIEIEKNKAQEAYDRDKALALLNKQNSLQQQLENTVPIAQQSFDFGPEETYKRPYSETDEAATQRRNAEHLKNVILFQQAEQERAQKVGPEVGALRRISERTSPDTTGIYQAFGQPTPPRGGGTSAMGQTAQRLQIEAPLVAANEKLKQARANYDRSPESEKALREAEEEYTKAQEKYQKDLEEQRKNEPIYTAEAQGELFGPAQKAPSEGFRLFARESEKAPATKEDLLTRVASAQAQPGLTNEAYSTLRKAEDTVNRLIETNTNDPEFLKTLDEQLKRIEEGAPPAPSTATNFNYQRVLALQNEIAKLGEFDPTDIQKVKRYQSLTNQLRNAQDKLRSESVVEGRPGAQPRGPAQLLKTFEPNVQKRVYTKAGEGALGLEPKPLALKNELEGHIRRINEALGPGPLEAQERQGQLFPKEQEKLGVIRSSAYQFQRFMDSAAVKRLREALDKDKKELEDLVGLEDLKERVAKAKKEFDELNKRAAQVKNANDVLKHETEVGKISRDINEIREAMTARVVDRMYLQGTLDNLKSERNKWADLLLSLPNKKFVEISRPFIIQLETVEEDYQRAVNEMAELQGALSTLEAQLRVENAKNALARYALNPVSTGQIEAARKELVAANTDLAEARKKTNQFIQTNIANEAAEKRRQEAIRRALAEKQNIEVSKERQKRLEAAYINKYPTEEYAMISEAQRAGREMADRAPTTNEDEQALRANPNAVLARVRGDITKLERKIVAGLNAAKQDLVGNIKPLAEKLDALNAQYRNANSEQRAALVRPLEEAQKDYDNAVDYLHSKPKETLYYIGSVKDEEDLSKLYAKAYNIEARIQSGELTTSYERAPKSAMVKERLSVKAAQNTIADLENKLPNAKTDAQRESIERRLQVAKDKLKAAETLAAAQKEAKANKLKATKERLEAPKTSVAPMTPSERKKASKPQKTVYGKAGAESREELRSKITREVKGREVVENEKYRLKLEEKKKTRQGLNAFEEAALRKLSGSSNITDLLNKDVLPSKNKTRVGAPTTTERKQVTKETITPDIIRAIPQDVFERDGQKAYSTTNVKDHPLNGLTFKEASLYAANKTKSPIAKQLFNVLADVFDKAEVMPGSGRVYVMDSALSRKDGSTDLGTYLKSLDVVYVGDPSSSDFYKIVLHELTHAATARAMLLSPELKNRMDSIRQKTIAWLNTAEGKTYFKNNAMNLGVTKPSEIYGLTDADEFVAELFSNRAFQKMLTEIPSDKPRTSIFTRLVQALAQFFDMPAKAAQSLFAEAMSLSEEVLNTTREQIYEGKAGPLAFEPGEESDTLSFAKTKYDDSELAAAGATADKIIATPKTIRQNVEANLGLSGRTQFLDRLAPLEKIAKEQLDPLKGTQMMYYLRMADQKMSFVQQAVAKGVPDFVEYTRKDGRHETIIESKQGANLHNVVNLLKKTPGMNAEAANRLFTLYLAGKRAERVGYGTLNFSVTADEIKTAVSKIEANAGVKETFEAARKEYNEYNRNLMNLLQKSGVISKEEAARLVKADDYIPYYRERNGNAQLIIGNENPITIGSLKDQPQLRQLIGGEEKILDFLTSSVKNTSMIVDASLRNRATRSSMNELVEAGLAKYLNKETAGPDIVRFKQNGVDKYVMVDTASAGIPADLLVKGLEGIPVNTSKLMQLMGSVSTGVRKAVTLNPVFAMRQIFRDSVAAPLLSGADFTPILGALKTLGKSATREKLESRGITGGQIFTGTNEDLTKILRDFQSGKFGLSQLIAKAEALNMEADASTRRAQYDSYIKQGLSEMEATLMSLESMNFNRKGLSPSVRMASQMIPFFNAQLQSLDVLYRAMTGKLPFNERLQIQKKLFQRGMLLAGTSVAYALLMQDDEAYKNATPDQKYGNFFVHIPGVEEPLRIPVPFEIGYIFKGVPEAIVNTMLNKDGGEEAMKAFKDIAIQTVPGGTSMFLPAAFKPIIENVTNYSFYTDRSLETKAEQMRLPEFRYRDDTSEVAKALGAATGVSPIKIENLIRGYTGTMGMALTQALSMAVPVQGPEQTAKRLSDMPVFGAMFQPVDAGGQVSALYDRLTEIQETKRTFDNLLATGQRQEAMALLQKNSTAIAQSAVAGTVQAQLNSLTHAMNAIKASNMTPEEKRTQLDRLQQIRINYAKAVREALNKT